MRGKRIRHLEFYGYADQNVFNGFPIIDLDEIKETNKEQDKEIDKLSGETMGKADMDIVDELSGKVDTFIEEQTEFDEEIASAITSIIEEVDDIEDWVDEYEESMSSITETLEEHIEDFEAFRADTAEKLSKLDDKLDIDVAEDTYAKKADVYTKEECDDKFLTEHQDISHLALKSDVEALQEEVDSLDYKYASKDELEALGDKVEEYKEATDEVIASVNSTIRSIEDEVEALDVSVASLNDAVDTIEEELGGKVGEEEFNERMGTVEVSLSGKVDTSTFTSTINSVYDDIHELDTTKASKRELSALTSTVDSLNYAISLERQDRAAADNNLSASISRVESNVDVLSNELDAANDSIEELRNDLTQEIADREQGDLDLIGSESGDTAASDTIWGAKRYAETQKRLAINQANSYTDEKVSGMESMVDNKLDEFATEISGKVDKDYVDALVAEKADEILEVVDTKYEPEIQELKNADANMEAEIEQLQEAILSGDTKDIYKRLNVITTYSGDTAEEYVDSGNGILDVLHREFHQLEDEIGVIANPTLVKTNEYEAAFGRYNASYTSEDASGCTMFSIGVGTGEYDRKNAFEVRENGDVYMWVEGEFMRINELLAMLAHERY